MGEIVLRVPKTINDIKLSQYQRWVNVLENNEDVQNNFLEIKLLEIFCGISGADAAKIEMTEANVAIEHVAGLLKVEQPLTERFDMTGSDGVVCEFGFIPNLSKMSLGEYVDLDTYIGDTSNLHKAMAVLYRPVHKSWKKKKEYRVAEYQGTEEYAAIMKDMPLGVALGALVFFYRLEKKLLMLSMLSSAKQLAAIPHPSAEERKRLLAATDGIKAYMLSLKEMHLELMPSPNLMFTQP